ETHQPGDEQQLGFHQFDCNSDYNDSSLPQTTGKKSSRAGMRKTGKWPLIRSVIFDLDDTLYDCFGQWVRVAHRYAARAMVKTGLVAEVEAVYRARMRAFRRDPMLRHIDAEVCRRFDAGDPEAVSLAARDAYFKCRVGSLRLFPGTLPLLRHLHARGVHS